MFEHWTRKCGGFCLLIWAIATLRLAFINKLAEPILFAAVFLAATSLLGAMAYKSNADRKVDKLNGKS
jgi:Flp pilus assembly protein TadB